MPKPPVPANVGELLERPNPAVITALRQDGQPVSVATWYVWEGGRILVNMDESRKRLDYMRADPRVSLTILAEGDWYSHVSIQGRVVSIEQDPDMADIDRISRHYTGHEFLNRAQTRYSAWIEIDYWHGWGAALDSRTT